MSPPALSDYNGSPNTSFSRGTTRSMSWPDGKRYLRPLQSLVVSFLLSLVSTLFFSRTGGVLSHQNFLTRRFPHFPPRNLCSLIMLAVFSLVFAATDTAFFLGSSLSRIGRIENPSCSACGHLSSHSALSSYGLFTPLTLWRLCLSTTYGPDPGELPGFWGSMVFRHAPVPRKGSGKQQHAGPWNIFKICKCVLSGSMRVTTSR